MSVDANDPEDLIEISCAAAVAAFDQFKQDSRGESRSERSEARFESALRLWMARLGHPVHKHELVLASKSTLSNWRTGKIPTRQTKRRVVLNAILALTGRDISARGLLAKAPLNFSAIVQLGPASVRKVSNDPEEIDNATFQIDLESTLFKSATMRVFSSWIRTANTTDTEIGEVRFGLTEASLKGDFSRVTLIDYCRRLAADSHGNEGRADGCFMVWSDQTKDWLVLGNVPGEIIARIEGVRLATVRGRRGQMIDIQVRAGSNHLTDHFTLRGPLTREPLNPTEQQRQLARQRLIALVLGQDRQTTNILALQRIKLP